MSTAYVVSGYTTSAICSACLLLAHNILRPAAGRCLPLLPSEQLQSFAFTCFTLLLLLQFAVSDHSYFDMSLELQLEVTHFKDSRESRTPPRWMFVGFMHRAVAALLDPAGDINSQCTKSPGWCVCRVFAVPIWLLYRFAQMTVAVRG
jgi:hypothetical protein